MKYRWGNNPKRVTMKGRECKIIARGKMNSILIEFENGQREVVRKRSVYQKICHNKISKKKKPAKYYKAKSFKRKPWLKKDIRFH